jgi:leucyl-tRNA synthetase
MQGKNVLYPMGFDAFGLPAENAAIKNNKDPREWTYANMAHMEQQLRSMGAIFDWSRKVVTCDPAYYRWTQWLFLKLYESKLAYRAEAPVNWCPKDQTVLANEQVLADGTCERCSTKVEQKNLTQWFFKITRYADELVSELDGLDWPEWIKATQRNWIGRSQGAEVSFPLDGSKQSISVFTTRLDTIYGATFLVLSPEHQMVESITSADQLEAVHAYVASTKLKSDLQRQENADKTGVFTGAYAINPATKEKIPVWIADYVLPHYGTGAIMAVPAHDERDAQFASSHSLPTVDAELKPVEALVAELGASKIVRYRLRDWLVSRQRYWGAPIPIIHCEKCGVVPVPEDQLPVLLPTDVDFRPYNLILSQLQIFCYTSKHVRNRKKVGNPAKACKQEFEF